MDERPSLIDVGNRLCLNVLEKMSTQEFYRMRRTCSFMNELAKDGRRMIAQRVPLVVVDHKEDIRMYIEGEPSYRSCTLSSFGNVQRGIDLSVLRIINLKLTPATTNRLLRWIARTVKYGPSTIDWEGDCADTVSLTSTSPAPHEFFSILQPDCLKGDLFIDKLYRWMNVKDMAGKRNWRPSPCWAVVRDFGKVEFTSSMKDIGPVLGLLMQEWHEGLDLGRCQFISAQIQPAYRKYTDDVLLGSLPREFLYDGAINERHHLEGYKERRMYERLELFINNQIRILKVYKMTNMNGVTCGVGIGRTAGEIYFAFSPKLEYLMSICKPIE